MPSTKSCKSKDLIQDAVPLRAGAGSLDSSSGSDTNDTYLTDYSDQTSSSRHSPDISRSSSSNDSSSGSSCGIASPASNSNFNSSFPFAYNMLSESSGGSMNEDELRWQSVNRHLKFYMNKGSLNVDLWKKLATTCYSKIEMWKEETLQSYETSCWDYSIIHTDNEKDLQIVQEFTTHLELEGLVGVSLLMLDIGKKILENWDTILNNSSLIFILDTSSFGRSGLHRLPYAEVIMKQLYALPNWHKKIIPVYTTEQRSRRKETPSFGLSSLSPLYLGNRTETINKIRRAFTTDDQSRNDKRRQTAKEEFKFYINCLKETNCQSLAGKLTKLKAKFEESNLSRDQLIQVCMQSIGLPISSSPDNSNQIIMLENCNKISIGPSFHFDLLQN